MEEDEVRVAQMVWIRSTRTDNGTKKDAAATKKNLVELWEALIDDTASSDSWSFRDTSSLVTSSFQWSLRKSAQLSIFIWDL